MSAAGNGVWLLTVTTPSSKKGRLLAILACGIVAFGLAAWLSGQRGQPTWNPSPELQGQSRFIPAVGQGAAELPVQAEEPPASSKLPVYELRIAPNDLRTVQYQPFGNSTVPATFMAEGKTYQVKIRARGSWSRSWPKKSLKIQFDHQNPFQDHNSLNLNSCWRDPAFVREALAYQVYANCGVIASHAQMVRLQVNGHFYGLYVQVEQPDKQFLLEHNLKGGELYKAISRSRDADERALPEEASYQGAYSKETKKTGGYHELVAFCQELAHTQDTLAFFNQHVDLENYINYLAATVLIQHWDGFNKNHYLVQERDNAGKWLVVPWDLDRTFGDHWQMRFDEARLPVLLGTRGSPGVTGWNRIEDRFFSEPTLRARFLDRLANLLEKEFTKEKLFPILDQLETQIAPEATLDRSRWPSPAGDFHEGIAGVKSFIVERRAYLQEQVPQLRRL